MKRVMPNAIDLAEIGHGSGSLVVLRSCNKRDLRYATGECRAGCDSSVFVLEVCAERDERVTIVYMNVTRWGRQEPPLSEFPAWGIEIMMGLYGERQVRAVIAEERGSTVSDHATWPVDRGSPHAGAAGDIAAVTSAFATLAALITKFFPRLKRRA